MFLKQRNLSRWMKPPKLPDTSDHINCEETGKIRPTIIVINKGLWEGWWFFSTIFNGILVLFSIKPFQDRPPQSGRGKKIWTHLWVKSAKKEIIWRGMVPKQKWNSYPPFHHGPSNLFKTNWVWKTCCSKVGLGGGPLHRLHKVQERFHGEEKFFASHVSQLVLWFA